MKNLFLKKANYLTPKYVKLKLQVCIKLLYIYLSLVDGDWSTWTAWSSCSVSCGGGYRERTRTCDKPAPADNGLYCEGYAVDIEECNEQKCNGGSLATIFI